MTSGRITHVRIARLRGFLLAGWLWMAGVVVAQAQQPLDTIAFPAAVKITRDGREPVQHAGPVFALEELSQGSEHAVFPGPPCLEGTYYVGFQLFYDLNGHRNTTVLWSDYLEVSLLHGDDTLWRQPLRVDMQSQTFLATIFHDQPIACDGDYRFYINRHDSTGVVPADYIDLRVLLYKQDQDAFNPALPINLDYCQSPAADHVAVAWSYAGTAWLEYDLEWVFIEEHESTEDMTPQQAFQFKRPARITTAASYWNHLAYYPKGRIWYRVRAVGYNPQYPGHRIPGAWSYSNCGAQTIENHQPGMTWQKQVVFAEEGKSKTIMQYFDGTLRQRQSLTNLNQEKVTVVAESLYDFEGRRSSDIMAVPALDAGLNYHESFNTFQAQDPLVATNTGVGRNKFHYDNYRLTNSILSNTSGAANYYSPQSEDSTIHQAFIPDAEGYVYNQTEYLRDGTGRVSRQSGVGKEFRMDGDHITRYYYAEPNREELVRLFGSNVGDVSHYKKNLVVDPNGQVSVSYLDQEDRVIATALAGDAPLNVEHLPSYDSLSTDSITVSILDRNTFQGTVSETVTKITNVSPSRYTFRYNLSALGATVEGLGCQTCVYDLDLVLTDPEGMKVDLSAYPGNQTPPAKLDGTYRRVGITAASCSDSTEANEVVLSIWMSEIGSYTLAKTLRAHELSYAEMATRVRQDSTFQQQVAALQQRFGVDSANCEICMSACPGTDSLIDKTIEDVSHLDCDNIMQQILSEIRAAHASEEEVYTPTEGEITGHRLYCKYALCNQNVASDIFDRRLARHTSWEDARAEYPSVLGSDPFFQDPALSGAGRLAEMTGNLANVLVGSVAYDANGDGTPDGSKVYQGALENVVNPDNTAFYVDANGVPDPDDGRHILYLDLMSRRAQMSQAAYEEELSQQRWTMYRAFYIEAKRKIKIAVYQGCGPALEELQAGDELLTLDAKEGQETWLTENGALGYAPVSDSEIEASINSIRNACGTEFSAQDRTAIAGHLRTYFDNNKKNYLRLILTTDVGNNADLLAVQQILDGYGCKLDSAALTNPLVCRNDTSVFVNQPFINHFPSTISMQDVTTAAVGDDWAVYKDPVFRRGLSRQSDTWRSLDSATVNAQNKAANTTQLQSTACVCPTQAEFDALMALYNSTNGAGWSRKVGWETASQNPGTVVSVQGWSGITVNAQGHVLLLSLASNGLSGTLPENFDNLSYLTTLNLDGNNISGGVPQILGKMWWLNSLSLASSHLTGTIPDTLRNLVLLNSLDLSGNQLTGIIPEFLKEMPSLVGLDLSDIPWHMELPEWLGEMPSIQLIRLNNCGFYGSIPEAVGNATKLRILDLSHNELSGNIPGSFANLNNIMNLFLNDNNLSGAIPSGLGNIANSICQWPTAYYGVPYLYLDFSNNELEGIIPDDFKNMVMIPANASFCGTPLHIRIDLSGNWLHGAVPIFQASANVERMFINVRDNKFTFTDLLPFKQQSSPNLFDDYGYGPQDTVDVQEVYAPVIGGSLTMVANVDRTTSPSSKYQWFRTKNGATTQLTTSASGNYSYTISNMSEEDYGAIYYYVVRNDEIPTLSLLSMPKLISGELYPICLEYDTSNVTLNIFKFRVDWDKRLHDCLKNAASEDSLLFVYAAQKLLETNISRFSRTRGTTCFDNTLENLAYTYTPREYHYTLYYYDQAANLVQTVPPAGVRTLSHDTVQLFLNGLQIIPPHRLITRYRYNSFNQLIWQMTPDAGESNFWYNNLGQLRLSQNAQQYKDTLYSYTRYDEQGRIVEVGEMATADSLHTLVARLDSLSFPQAASYTLTDITRTHYDFARPGLPADFEQQHLRTRVSWVEVLEKYHTDTISTAYNYDIHGNVRSLLQDIPGLSPKRMDYVYDLVSGKVNYVLYQFDQPDQFIHRYGYDDDNRITDVHTSSDGFIWDHDARYYYYKHGPLARTELGEYRVQGLDYYYTLQGWIKGVNLPYQDDPTVGNVLDQGVGKDVFSYALGYYQNDYKPVSGLVPPDTRDNLWTRQQEVHGHTGLYNGNISWMITDLAKLGEVAGDRTKGMQAMLYKYDQLHRLVKSRGLTQYASATGFAARQQTPGAYDEDYTYDPNGNILTLLRHNETGGVMDDFSYQYYGNTNKLREVKPVTKTKEYSSGPIRTDNIVYRNVKIHGTAHVPAGSTVEVKALDDIFMDPDFQAHEESDFWAHIVEDEGTYQYDAIGNLILDQDAGVKIRWTPYGKVRDVSVKEDSIVVTFRYDAAGNRVGKTMVRRDSADLAQTTGYVRDASGNVMAVYRDTMAIERPLYGSSRLGQYVGIRQTGSRVLGGRRFELSNHLGNVLAVVRDLAIADGDNISTAVVSVGDYYPFGLDMDGRVWSDTTSSYRYGFNGKEKDDKGEWGNVVYDYGFRIYNPSIGKFLSVDPLAFDYASLTPYQYASNTPVRAKDLDGLEALIDWTGSSQAYTVISLVKQGYTKDQAVTHAKNWSDRQAKAGAGGVMFGAGVMAGYGSISYGYAWTTANWHHVIFNPIIQNEIAATIYGLGAEDEWPIPSVGAKSSKTAKYVYRGAFRGFTEVFELTGSYTATAGAKFSNEAERMVVKMLVSAGDDVVHLAEQAGKQKTPDFLVNGVKTEIKNMILDKNTVYHLVDAVRQVGEGGVIYWVRAASSKSTLKEMQDFADKFIPKLNGKEVDVKINVIEEIIPRTNE